MDLIDFGPPDLICNELLEEPQDCAICQEEIALPVVLECKHSFCLVCIHQSNSIRKTCPLCRATINSDKIPITGLHLSDLENLNTQIESPLAPEPRSRESPFTEPELRESRSSEGVPPESPFTEPELRESPLVPELLRSLQISMQVAASEELQVYYISEENVVALTTLENYGRSTDRTKVAYECWTCKRFTDYTGHSFGCLGCKQPRIAPRSMFRADLENGEVSVKHMSLENTIGTYGSYSEMAAAARRYIFESNIVVIDGCTRVLHNFYDLIQ